MDHAIGYDPVTATLNVGGVAIGDPEVIREACRWTTGQRGEPVTPDALADADLEPFIREALTVGARVLSLAAQHSDTLAVQQAVRTASEHVAEVVSRATQAADDAVRRASDSIGRTTREAHETLLAQVTRLVGGENPELMERLRPLLAGVGSDLEKQVGEAVARANESIRSETDRRHDALVSLIHDVRQEVAVKVATAETALAVKQGTTVKGFDFESQLHAVLTDIAAALGDDYVETGDRAGALPRNKKGDGVLTLGGGLARLVFEAHDGTSKDWGPYLAEAERNRGAVAAVGVVKHLADNAGHAVRVIAPKRLVVAFDPERDDPALLRTVVLLMRTVALTSTGRFGTEGVATANERIREALDALADLDDAKRSASAITGHVEKIERTVAKTMTTVQRELHAALTALTGAGAPEGDAGGAGSAAGPPVALVEPVA